MASAPNGSFWEVRDDFEVSFNGQQYERSIQSLSPLITQHHAYSNEALVDGDEYFSDHMEYEEPTSHRRNRQRPLGASPVHRGQVEAEQRRLMGKSMPQLNESIQSNSSNGPGRPVRQHRYEVIPPGPGPRTAANPPPPPAPLPPRPNKNQTPPRQSSVTPPKRTPSNASQVRRQGSITRSAPGPSVSAMSHPKMAVFLQNSSVTPRRNLTPLMNSMSPQRHSDRRPSRPQHISHRRSLSMSSSNPKIKTTAIVAPSTYKSYDLEGLSYESPHRAPTELEADMAELHASLMASPSRFCRTAPKPLRKSSMKSPNAMVSATSTSPLNMDSPSPASSKFNTSWVRLPGGGWVRKPSGAVGRLLVATGVLLLLCGLAAGVMCFYLLSQKGRTYYLDLGVLASFTSMLLGAFGLRSRAAGRIPNRNYITAYLLLTTFAILSVGGLVAIILAPPPIVIGLNATTVSGTAIIDIAGGAVCTTSAMTLLLTAVGMFLAYCSHYPPPDNRVGSCSPGFRV